jgi:ABC-type polysaccharide/polyol phosphate transport system ATPase subunit
MSDCSIACRQVSLNIPVFAPNQQRLIRKDLFSSAVGGRFDRKDGKVHVKALCDVSFDVRTGEHLALIGHNGAGKTTLLKTIAGIYPPSSGEVVTRGSIGCLFNIGAGLTPEITGREYINFYHMVFGAPGDSWDELVADITEFTELGAFLELPIRTYSDGMRTRLTAALATASRRDILLIDEEVGAGDAAFQEKFSARVNSFLRKAGLLVIASHSTKILRQYCTRGLVLVHGEPRMLGDLEEALDYYERLN